MPPLLLEKAAFRMAYFFNNPKPPGRMTAPE
jgi:hypothetical protein